MITDSYNLEKGKISPEDIYGPGQNISDTCIATFSYKLMNMIIDKYKLEKVSEVSSTNGMIPIYAINYKGKRICVYNSPMGSALAGTYMIEIAHKVGAKKFIMFGSAGRLDCSIPSSTFIVPTEAYRDEGFSYHYAPPSDYIKIKNHKVIEDFLTKNNINFVKGKCWTTDAFYKETESEITLRKKEGCIAVEMECAGCQAVADFYHFYFYEMFFGDDLLDAEAWDKAYMGLDRNKFRHEDIFKLSLDLALEI